MVWFRPRCTDEEIPRSDDEILGETADDERVGFDDGEGGFFAGCAHHGHRREFTGVAIIGDFSVKEHAGDQGRRPQRGGGWRGRPRRHRPRRGGAP